MKHPLDLPSGIGDELVASLINSAELETPELFIDVVMWAQSMLLFREHANGVLATALDTLENNLAHHIREPDRAVVTETLRRAREELSVVRLAESSLIDDTTPNGAIARRYLDALLEADEARAAREVLLAIAHGQKTLDVYQHVLAPALHEAGRLWQRNEITVAHEHIITSATQRVMSQLVDVAPSRPHRDLCALAVATGPAEHEVGARMVADAFALCGWQASFLGGAVPVDDVVRYIENVSVDVVACSASIPRDVLPIRDLIDAFESQPVAPVVIVGGRAFDEHPTLWRKIGADGYGVSPLMAVAVANELISVCD